MTHSDDDGLVLPPRLAPNQIVILPIYRDDQQREEVLRHVEVLKADLMSKAFRGSPVRVTIDDRDIRGGEKKWHHVKRGVPIRLEVGPKDIEKGSVFVGRRDQPKSFGMSRDEFVARVPAILEEMQQGLFDRAAQLRKDHSHDITNESEFRDFFSSTDEQQLHGGFAHCHFIDEQSLDPLLKELKVTIRCVPSENNEEPGVCFATGRPAEKKAIFAKAY